MGENERKGEGLRPAQERKNEEVGVVTDTVGWRLERLEGLGDRTCRSRPVIRNVTSSQPLRLSSSYCVPTSPLTAVVGVLYQSHGDRRRQFSSS